MDESAGIIAGIHSIFVRKLCTSGYPIINWLVNQIKRVIIQWWMTYTSMDSGNYMGWKKFDFQADWGINQI